MRPVELKKEHFGVEKDVGIAVRAGCGWITNGHWMVREEYIFNSELFKKEKVTMAAFSFIATYRELDKDTINSVIPGLEDQKKLYLRTSWIYEHNNPKTNLRAFKALKPTDSDEKVILFDDRYIKGFNIDRVVGNGAADGTYVILDDTVHGEPELMMILRTCHNVDVDPIYKEE